MSLIINTVGENVPKTIGIGLRNKKLGFTMRRLRLSLKYRPDILKLVIKMRQTIRRKNSLLKELKYKLKCMEAKYRIFGAEDDKNVNILQDKLSLKEKNSVQNDLNMQIQTHKTLATQTDAAILEKECIDKSISCVFIMKDSCSQTKIDSDGCIDDFTVKDDKTSKDTSLDERPNTEGLVETEAKMEIINSGETEPKTNEVFTQTETTLNNETGINVTDVNLATLDKSTRDFATQTESSDVNKKNKVVDKDEEKDASKITDDKVLGWTKSDTGEEEKSIAEQVKEVAQSAMQESGMVYVESAGMYYDYKTGYYYNSELGLYYHTDTGCYYYYSDQQKTFVFHSYPDRSLETRKETEKSMRRPKKHKKANKSDDIENLTKNFSQDEDTTEASKAKRKRMSKHKKSKKVKLNDTDNKETETVNNNNDKENHNQISENQKAEVEKEEKVEDKEDKNVKAELEDGECSDSDGEKSDSSMDGSDVSTSTASEDESVAKHHPPCMRVVVRETNLPKLKVGSLFLVTKDGGTIGREGEHHAILLKDFNVSRNHLDIKFDSDKRIYTAVDLGSKNGTILNGVRMSDSQEISQPMEIVHGSTIQLGETKLLCHIHAGNDTCGHCEPGLIMEAEDKEKKAAYTRTCSVQKQHQLELARLKNKYAPKLLEIEETAYNDRAQARRETVGSSHHSEKTQRSDLDTCIPADNKGFKLLEKMGWSKGEGLGKDNQGDQEPVPLVSNEGKAGLGASPAPSAPPVTSKLGPATLRLAARTKMLQPPAKAFQQPAGDEDSE